MAWNKPLPDVTHNMLPFYESLRSHKLKLLRCKTCDAWYWPAAYCRDHNTEPYGGNMQWVETSGKGKVFVFSIHYWNFDPAFKDDVPYVLALVETKEGPLIPTSITGCDPKEVHIGMPVQVVFEDIDEQFTLPRFEPIR
ncbi:Zn-ribbon domain-containing OB-fold protein [Thermodesulfobacteriota bacterium]